MKAYIVVIGIVLAASSAQAQTLEISYQQKHATVTVPELPHTNVSAKGHDGIAQNFSCVALYFVEPEWSASEHIVPNEFIETSVEAKGRTISA